MIRFVTITTILVVICSISIAQDLVQSAATDSLKMDTIVYTPYFKSATNLSTHYEKRVDDKDLLKLASGTSIFNVLRGQVPSLNLPAYFANAQSAGLRNRLTGTISNTNILIDGLPFNSSIGTYVNTNAFEFASIATASSANATSFLNGSYNGGFMITSKTGEGYTKPMIEFNSATTNGWQEVTSLSGKKQLNEWYLSNSLAYNQDFGAVDLRISYNLLSWNSDLPLIRFMPTRHNLKINSGYNIGNKFKARLIVDGMYLDASRKYEFGIVPPPIVVNEAVKEMLYQGNLTLQYQVLPWLKLSSQWSLSQRDSSFTITKSSLDNSSGQLGDQRVLGNLFVNIGKQLSKNFWVSGFLGYQLVEQRRDLSRKVTLGSISVKSSFDTPHLAAGAQVGYKEMINLELTQRMASYDYLPTSDRQQSNYTVGSSFVFSKIWKPSFLSFGKVRANWGKVSHEPILGYPFESTIARLRNPTPIINSEIGIDVASLQSKLKVSFNYFTSDETLNVSQGFLNPFEKRLLRGWDSEMSYEVVKRSNLSIELGLLLSSIQEGYQAKGGATSDYGSPNTRNSLFFKLKTSRILFTSLVESVRYSDPLVTTSFVKLRDVSVGYKAQASLLTRLGIKEVFLSITGRNLYVLSSTGVDFESLYLINNGLQKSITANLSFVF